MQEISTTELTISVVSHSQAGLIKNLLADLANVQDIAFEIVVTINIPEDERLYKNNHELPIKFIRNKNPKGFGANHNQAFSISNGAIFAVVNPDVRLTSSLRPILESLSDNSVGACAPKVISADGKIEDSFRKFPNFWRLFKRFILKSYNVDYKLSNDPIFVDWVAGMFIGFRRNVFHEINGFDERYFMYLEDADICMRLKNHGKKIVVEPKTTIIHDAQRTSRKSIKYLLWHLKSAFIFLKSH